MKKKLGAILMVLALCMAMAVPALAEPEDEDYGNLPANERVQDSAKLLSSEERLNLQAKLDEISDRQQLDVVVVTTDSLDDRTAEAYADDMFDYGGYGYGDNRDGVLFLISMEEREWHISTRGYGITAFTDAGIQYIGKQMKPDLKAGNYAKAFDTYADLCDEFITKARNGNPYDVKSLPREPLSFKWIPISIVVGVVLAFIVVGMMKSKLKTVRNQAEANDYLKPGSLDVTERRELFLYHTLTRTAKPKDDDSSGGSSTHTSSSGATHGGGGGSF